MIPITQVPRNIDVLHLYNPFIPSRLAVLTRLIPAAGAHRKGSNGHCFISFDLRSVRIISMFANTPNELKSSKVRADAEYTKIIPNLGINVLCKSTFGKIYSRSSSQQVAPCLDHEPAGGLSLLFLQQPWAIAQGRLGRGVEEVLVLGPQIDPWLEDAGR